MNDTVGVTVLAVFAFLTLAAVLSQLVIPTAVAIYRSIGLLP